MKSLKAITSKYAVTAGLLAADFDAAARAGFASIINFQLDDEAPGQLSASDGKRLALAAGLAYAHLPVSKYELFADTNIAEAARLLASLPQPILAQCASGQRAAILWAAANARTTPVDQVLETLETAGFEFEFLRDDLDAQADRARWAAQTTEPVSKFPETLSERAAA